MINGAAIPAVLFAVNRMKEEADAIEKIKDNLIKNGAFYYSTVILEVSEVEMLIQAISCELSEMGTAGDSDGFTALQNKLEAAIARKEDEQE